MTADLDAADAGSLMQTMLAKKAELDAARDALTREYRSRPRRTSMGHVWAQAMNRSRYSWAVKDARDGYETVASVIALLDKALRMIARAHARLAADPWVCRSEKRAREWREAVAARARPDEPPASRD